MLIAQATLAVVVDVRLIVQIVGAVEVVVVIKILFICCYYDGINFIKGTIMNANVFKMVIATSLSAFLVVGCGEEEKAPVESSQAAPAVQVQAPADEQSAVDKMKEGTAMALEGAKEKAVEVTEQVSESTSEMVEKAGDVTADAVEAVKDATADTVEAAKEMTAEGADKVKEAVK